MKKLALLFVLFITLFVVASAQAQAVDAQDRPFVRITYICQAPEEGTTTHGAVVQANDYVWRIRYEAGNSQPQSPASVSWSTNFLSMAGTISLGETQFVSSVAPANGVKVITTPSNLYGGTASVSGAVCTMAEPPVEEPPVEEPPVVIPEISGSLWQVTVWPDTQQMSTDVVGIAWTIAGSPVVNFELERIVTPVEHRDRQGQSGIVPNQALSRLVTGIPVVDGMPLLSDYVAYLIFADGTISETPIFGWYDINGEFLPDEYPGGSGISEYRPSNS